MCVYSMITDHYHDKWREIEKTWPPFRPEPAIPQSEIDEFRKLLERAREYDRKNNEPDCGLEDKKKKVRELADRLGVKVEFL